VPELLQDWVTLQAERQPEAIAVVLNGDKLTYGELEATSSQLAGVLKEQGCRRGDRVCLLMPKSPMAIACLLGIYRADCIYVPLDPNSPTSRLSKIVASCESRWVLAAGSTTSRLRELLQQATPTKPLAIGWLDPSPIPDDRLMPAFTLADVRRQQVRSTSYRNRPSDAAHILFTSGSTGIPKGVVITHANVMAFISWAKTYFGLNASDRLSGHPPLHFDLSVFDIFGAFSAGAQLHLVPPELNLLPNKLADWIRGSQITQWFSVPAVLNYMTKFNVIHAHDFPELRRVLWCGEVLPTPSLIYWMRRLPHASFTNLYGPTETTIASSYHTLTECPADDKASIPIGVACDGEELLVLDDALKPAAAGDVGDLYIRGAGLSPGYWRNQADTTIAFLPSPDNKGGRIYRTGDLARRGNDGLVYFVGRRDFQVKSRGYRIELGEIESALNTVDQLYESAVVAVPSRGFEGVTICCAYAPKEDCTVTPAILRMQLSNLLPEYMIPSEWRVFDELPKNSAGKIDRRKLKETWQEHGVDSAR
jgi:amino acid adenylation domain-containing protein